MTNDLIKAAGFLLSWYEKDLNYFLNFIKFSEKEISMDDYCKKESCTFKSFIDDYRVARSVKKELIFELLEVSNSWFRNEKGFDIDGLAQLLKLQGITYGYAISLSSKLMYLMNPQEVLPYDYQARKALKIPNEKSYSAFLNASKIFENKHYLEIKTTVEFIYPMLKFIEKPYLGKIPEIDKVRKNRFLDKWLWVLGSE